MKKTAGRILICLLILCLLAACNKTGQPSKIQETRTSPHGQGLQPNAYGVWPTDDFQTSSPEKQGVDANVILERLETAQKKGELPDSYLVMRNGYLISETYFHGYDKDTAHTMYSVTKSILSALVGIAIEDGYISGVEQKVQDFFPEVPLTDDLQYKKEMTIEHLLTMTSGVWGDEKWEEMDSAESMGAALFTLAQKKEPGEQFRYDSMATNLLAILVSRATGEKLYDYAKERLFDPLGMDSVVWEANNADENCGGYGISMTPRDMLRFGYLYLNYGRWEDRQIVPPDWVAQSPPQLQQSGAYGRLFWANEDNPEDGYEAAGMYGQYITIFPELNMVVVVTNNDNKNREILYKDIKKGLSDTPLPENPQAQENLAKLGQDAAQQPGYDDMQKQFKVKKTYEVDPETLKAAGHGSTPAPSYSRTEQGWRLESAGWQSGVETRESFQYPLMVIVTYIPD